MNSGTMKRGLSVTHEHLLAVVNTRIADLGDIDGPIRICDMGCGDGHLLGYMAAVLPELQPHRQFEFYGVDVSDPGVQASGFFQKTRDHLGNIAAAIDWTDRLKLIQSDGPWPFDDGAIHIVVSNQVLEHVFGHAHFFAELHRVTATGGFSAHLFPVLDNWWEGHLLIPFAHRIREHHLRLRFIRAMSRLGFGRYRAHRDQLGMSLDTYAEEHADYIGFMTNYRSWRELLDLAKAAGLRADYEYTERYYYEALRRRLGKPPRARYDRSSVMGSLLSRLVLKRVASVTLNTEKRQSYAR